MGCCKTYGCTSINGVYEYRLVSSNSSSSNCTNPLGGPYFPCDGSPQSTGYFYKTWSEGPCCTGTCNSYCLEPTCTWSAPQTLGASPCGEGCACESFEGQPCTCGTVQQDPCIRAATVYQYKKIALASSTCGSQSWVHLGDGNWKMISGCSGYSYDPLYLCDSIRDPDLFYPQPQPIGIMVPLNCDRVYLAKEQEKRI